jgi:hypothetical protein
VTRRWAGSFCRLLPLLLAACGERDPSLGGGEPVQDPTGEIGTGSEGVVPGGAAAATGPVTPPVCDDGSYFPMSPGRTWTFLVTKAGDMPFTKVQRVLDLEPVPIEGSHFGKMGFRVETNSGKAGILKTVSWQFQEGTRLARYGERQTSLGTGRPHLVEYWDPPRTRLDQAPELLVPGAGWKEVYLDYKFDPTSGNSVTLHTDYWYLEAIDEVVTVPAGVFKTIRVKKLLNSDSDERGKTYWFSRCLGKVKERGIRGQRNEDLVSFTVPN